MLIFLIIADIVDVLARNCASFEFVTILAIGSVIIFPFYQ